MEDIDRLASLFGPKLVREYNDVIDILQRSGLTLYETKVYLALIVKGWGEVSTIANTANIPRTSAYKALETLMSKGFIYIEKGRPVIYKPYPPLDVAEELVAKIKDAFNKLNELSKIIQEYGEPEIVYMLKGENKIIEMIKEIIGECRTMLIISSPKFNMIRNHIEKDLEKAISRGVDITVIHPRFQKNVPDVRVIVKDDLITTDVLGDSEHALLASHDLALGGYTNNPILAEHLKQFLEVIIKNNDSKN